METMVKQSILLQTPVLQEMVSKAVKACSYLEAFPITGYLKLVAKEGKLTITSTDNINIRFWSLRYHCLFNNIF